MSEENQKQKLRNWIIQKNGQINETQIDFDTKILEEKLISSLQIMELILFLGKLKGSSLNMENVKPGSFSSINIIHEQFLK